MLIVALFQLGFVLFVTTCRTAVSHLKQGPADPTWSWNTSLTRAIVHATLDFALSLPRPLHRQLENTFRTPIPRRIRESVRREVVHLGGVRAERFARADGAAPTTLLYLHGGGYVGCSLAMYQNLTAWLAAETGATVYSLEYRLAPEHPFPAAIDDAVAAYTALLDQGVDPASIVIGGDSAGAGLTLALLLSARSKSLPLPAASVCLSPYVDLTLPGESIRANAHSDILPIWPGHQFVDWYLAGTDPAHPLVSPIHADLAGLPPMLVLSGGREMFRDDIRVFVERARRAGVPVDFHEYEHMFHVWPLVMPWHADSRRAMKTIASFVGRRIEQASLQIASGA